MCRAAPDDPAVLQLAATIALRRGAPVEALELIRRSLALRPGHVPSLIIAARAAGEPAQAAAVLREAVRLAPALPEPLFLLLMTMVELKDAGLADGIEQAAMRFPGEAERWHGLGVALHRAGRRGLALAAFTRAAGADPGRASTHYAVGFLLRDDGRMSEARAALQRAVLIDPAMSAAWFALGLTCQDLLDEAGAAEAFEAALAGRENFAEAAVNLGIARQRLGEMDAALDAYRRAVKIRPDTFGRIAQAVTAAATGVLWLDLGKFRRWLGA
jgi:tetratricopeptide (TPR) repeat protein